METNMKKILTEVLIVTCMMSMVACGKQDATAGTSISEEVSSADISSSPTEKDETVSTEKTTDTAEESSEETKKTEDDVTPKFKELMDSYEEFFDEYVDFINKYKNADAEDMVALTGDYADYMTKYTEMMDKMQKIENDDLSTQDAAYYVEVTARINQKLLTVAE